MALPKLLQKLFQNGGVGPKLRPEIMPIQTVDGYAPDESGNVDTNRLPLSGGTMSGNILFDNGSRIIKTNDEKWKTLDIYSKENSTGAALHLRANDSPTGSGSFSLLATDTSGGQIYSLDGLNDGSLTWYGKNIVRSVNGVTADAAGNVSITKTIMPDYSAVVALPAPSTVDKTWTATADGFIVASLFGCNGGNGRLNINGYNMFIANTNSVNFATYGTGMFLVSKGDVVKYRTAGIDSNQYPNFMSFYPMKGV